MSGNRTGQTARDLTGSFPVICLTGVAFFAFAGTAAGNPALAENLRKSPVAEMAAGATTVADQLAIRRFGNQFGNQPPAGQTYQGTGFVLPRYGYGNHGGHHPGGYYGHDYPGFDPDDDRLPDNFDLDHYDDRKPWKHDHNGSRRGSGVRVYGSGFNTVYYNNSGFGYPNYRGWNDWWWDPYPYGIDGRLVSGIQPGSQLRMPGPSSAAGSVQAPPPEPETDLDAGRRLLSGSAFGTAIERYRAHLAENPDAFEVMAELVVALAGDGRLDDAAALARLAYERDPGLATKAVNERVSLDRRELRKAVVRAVRHAHDRESASAWLLVTLLMQAEDRDSVGLDMLQRSVDRGLPSGIADPLKAALR